ncbi:MAG: AI-2E family transporter [Caldilineaceae bacterium]
MDSCAGSPSNAGGAGCRTGVFTRFYRFYMVVFIFFVAVTLQIAMKPAVTWLHKRGMQVGLAVGLIYLLLLVLIVGFIWLAVPLLFEQTSTVASQIPGYYEEWRLSFMGAGNRLVRAFALALPAHLTSSTNASTELDSATLDTMQPVWQTLTQVSYLSFVIGAILMLAYYWMLEGDVVTRRLLFLVRPEQRPQWQKVLAEIELKIGSYFRGQIILCVVVGLLSLVGYLLIGLPYAFGLGVFMGFMEAIPMIGPILGAVPAILVALTESPELIWWVVGVVTVVQLAENNLLVPKIMDKSVGIHAIVTILAIAAFGVLFGLAGAVLAIPLAAVLQILFDRFVLNIAADDEDAVALTTTHVTGRSRISNLRLEAQDLVGDLRKQARSTTDVDAIDANTERVEDLLEAIADDLDGLLSQMEGTP